MLKRLLNTLTHRLFELPILVLMPHSRCNCRCVMCDIWKANQEKKEISIELLEKHVVSFRELGVTRVTLSGGEALMHSNLWRFCEVLKTGNVKISLLSTGITLKNHASEVVNHCDDVIVSLDGSPDTHNRIRNIPGAFEKLEEGVRAIKELDPGFRTTGRTVLQKQNFSDFAAIIRTAQQLGLDQISFLAADVSSEAFNRANPWNDEKVSEVALSKEEIDELEGIMKISFVEFKGEFKRKFIAESEEKLMDICLYYRALYGKTRFPKKKCNAPWVSAVIESNGDVRPCFFHKSYGNIHESSFEEVLNSGAAISFRKNLDIKNNEICQRCVCSLNVPFGVNG